MYALLPGMLPLRPIASFVWLIAYATSEYRSMQIVEPRTERNSTYTSQRRHHDIPSSIRLRRLPC